MINVKSFRSEAVVNPDPSDPLGLVQPERNNTKILGTWLGGLTGLGLYLRSFLGAETSAAAELESGAPKVETDEESVTSNKPRFRASQETTSRNQERESEDRIGDEESSADRFRYPVVLGPFESMFHEPSSFSSFGIEMPRGPANRLLPPYSSFGGIFENPQSNLSNSTSDGGAPAARDDPDTDSSPDVVEDEKTPDDTQKDPEQDRNRAPRNLGPVVIGDVGSGAVLAMSLSYFLSRTEDPDGDVLSVSMKDSTSADLVPKGDGWLYLADTEFLGEVKIVYTISDGEFSIDQTAILTLIENILTGRNGDDLIVGTHGRDVITGLNGDDNLAGLSGHDRMYGDGGDDNISGGAGNDSLSGGDGDDLIAGGSGDDWISGGAGDDRLYGEDGNDTIDGGAGNDEIEGGAGQDVLSGGTGQDKLSGNDGDDVLFSGAGDDEALGGAGIDILFGGEGDDLLDGGYDDDVLSGDAGRDMLYGGFGNDVLSGGTGADTVHGGAGDDTVVADDDYADDDYDGGEGHDWLDYSAATAAVAFDLIKGTVTGESVGTDSFENFEHLVGSRNDDHFRAGYGAQELTGNGGSDIYDFLQGDTVDIIRSVYQINDFDNDDRIWIASGSSHREIRKEQRSLEERIEDDLDDYADGMDVDEPRLTYRYDWTDTYRRTVIEVDFDRDRVIDLELRIEGEHIVIVESI